MVPFKTTSLSVSAGAVVGNNLSVIGNVAIGSTAQSNLDKLLVDGTQGRLFTVTDVLTGTLFSVNNITGLPILEVTDQNTVIAGQYNTNAFVLSGTRTGLGTTPIGTNRLSVSGDSTFVGTISTSSHGTSENWNTAFNRTTQYQSLSSTFATNSTVSSVSSLLTPLTVTRTLTGQLLLTSIYQGASGNWQSAYTTVQTNSASWEESADITAITTTVASNSSNWNNAYNTGTVYQTNSATYALKNTNAYVIAEPGDNLATKYAQAKALTPNGSALSSTNRAALVIQPGNYTLAAELAVDTQFVDLIGLGAIKLRRGCVPAVIIDGNTLNVTANDVRVQGVSVGTQAFKIGTNLPLQIFEDCAGGDSSFTNSLVSGTFVNCTGGNYSFGGVESSTGGTLDGTFQDCTGGDYSFGGGSDGGDGGTLSGTFQDCTGGGSSFGGSDNINGGTLSGTFKDCTGGGSSFGSGGFAGGTLSGTFKDCTGGGFSFGSEGGGGGGGGNLTSTSVFINCTGEDYSFCGGGYAGGTLSGTFKDCAGGNYSFGGGEGGGGGNLTSTSVFTNCTGEDYSFGGASGGNAGTLSGTFQDCTGGEYSFGGGSSGTATGKFYQCRLTSGTFITVTGAGLMRNCIDGNNNIVDQ